MTEASWDPSRGALRVAAEGRDGPMAFRIVCDIVPVAGHPWFLCDVVSLDNIGDEAFPDAFVLLRQYAPWAGDTAKPGAIRTAPNVWREPDGGVWFRIADGAWCGAATTAPTVRHFRYWITPDGKSHPDAGFQPPSAPLRLAPGASWKPEGTAWMVCAAGSGTASWRDFLDALAR